MNRFLAANATVTLVVFWLTGAPTTMETKKPGSAMRLWMRCLREAIDIEHVAS
jgi:hypothetical protein